MQLWGDLEAATKTYGNDALTDALWFTAGILCSQAHPQNDHVLEIYAFIRDASRNRTLSIVDRDPARRASMEEKGYLWGLLRNFGGEASVYRERPDASLQELVEHRQGIALDCLPNIIGNETWPLDSTPYAHITYKSTCFGDEQARWNCTSDHSHVCKICSSAADPTRLWMSKIAR